MVTQQQPVLTLRLGGVEFTLIPTDRDGRATFLQPDDHDPRAADGRVSWALQNFTGILEAGPAATTVAAAVRAADEERAASATRAANGAGGDASGGSAPKASPKRKNGGPPAAAKAQSRSKSGTARKQASISFAPPPAASKRGVPESSAAEGKKLKGKNRREQEETIRPAAAKKSRTLGFAAKATAASRTGAGEVLQLDIVSAAAAAAAAAAATSSTTKDLAASEAAKGEEPTQREAAESQPTQLGQSDGSGSGSGSGSGGRSFLLSQDTNTNSSFPSDDRALQGAGGGGGGGVGAAGFGGGIAAAAPGGGPPEAEGAAAFTNRIAEEKTIQDIMDSAPSQATLTAAGDETVDPTPAWTDDEGEEAAEASSEPLFPTIQEDRVAVAVATGAAGGGGSSATLEPAVNPDLPRVSLGPSPRKGAGRAGADGPPAAAPAMLSAPTEASEPTAPPPAAVPCPRWGHTLTSIGNRRLVLYGGQTLAPPDKSNAAGRMALPTTLNDVVVYDTVENTWFQPSNCQGLPRQWHTSTYIPDRQLLVAFGGESAVPPKSGKPGQPGKVKTSDTLTVLDTDLMLWYPPAVSGDVPPGRSGHTATLVGKSDLVVIGGVRGSKWLNAVCVLDVDRWAWAAPKVQGVPPKPRSYHTATAISDRRIVVFGGNDSDASFNSVHVLQQVSDDSDESAAAEDGGGGGKCWRWTNPSCQGAIPSPRTGHAATLLDDRKTICVYGGWDPNADDDGSGTNAAPGGDDDSHMFSSDKGCCYLLDTATWTWRKGGRVSHAAHLPPHIRGADAGSRRAGHAAAPAGDNRVLAFGGRVPGDRFAGDFQALSDF